MRLSLFAAAAPLVAASVLFAAGCEDQCVVLGNCGPYDGPTASTSSAGGASASSGSVSTSSQGTGGGPPAGCELKEGEAIGLECGVFVKAGGSGDGAQASPLGDIQQAIAAVGASPRVYVCGGDTFTGSVTLPGGISIFGGLKCDTWTYAAANLRPLLQGEANVPTLTVSDGTGKSFIDSVDIEAASATTAGTSSVAVDAVSTTLELRNCNLSAGNGADGAPGNDGGAQAAPAPAGNGGQPGGTVGSLAGGLKSTDNVCADGTTNGGKGGDGGAIPNSVGQNGELGDSGTGATPGFGDNGAMAWSCASGIGGGGFGSNGFDSPFGDGAPSADFGHLLALGFTNASGKDGTGGTRGQGGGGGGGSKASTTNHGAGGGSGGAGGCGGVKGMGGGGGGSSFGVVSFHANVTLENVSITLGSGGKGGKGGNGQLGQPGGNPGTGGTGGAVNDACTGGKGGRGGHGGSGGGGRGGHAIALGYVGASPTGTPVVTSPGTGGSGGIGGTNGNDQGGTGADGVAESSRQLTE